MVALLGVWTEWLHDTIRLFHFFSHLIEKLLTQLAVLVVGWLKDTPILMLMTDWHCDTLLLVFY